MSWVFKKVYTHTLTYEVGYYPTNQVPTHENPEFTLIKEFDNFEDAANLVHYLNGGSLSKANHLYKIKDDLC